MMYAYHNWYFKQLLGVLFWNISVCYVVFFIVAFLILFFLFVSFNLSIQSSTIESRER